MKKNNIEWAIISITTLFIGLFLGAILMYESSKKDTIKDLKKEKLKLEIEILKKQGYEHN